MIEFKKGDFVVFNKKAEDNSGLHTYYKDESKNNRVEDYGDELLDWVRDNYKILKGTIIREEDPYSLDDYITYFVLFEHTNGEYFYADIQYGYLELDKEKIRDNKIGKILDGEI